MPGSPGCSSANACWMPLVTSIVFAPGNFSMTIISPGPPLMTASPASGGKPYVTSATLADP